MGRSHRSERMGEEIRKIISGMLMRGSLKDPGFSESMISVSAVDVTGDGSYATVYISALPLGRQAEPQEDRKRIAAAFERSAGHIRTELGKNLKARRVPELAFRFDESLEYGAKMDAILDRLEIKPEEPAEHPGGEEDFED